MQKWLEKGLVAEPVGLLSHYIWTPGMNQPLREHVRFACLGAWFDLG